MFNLTNYIKSGRINLVLARSPLNSLLLVEDGRIVEDGGIYVQG